MNIKNKSNFLYYFFKIKLENEKNSDRFENICNFFMLQKTLNIIIV